MTDNLVILDVFHFRMFENLSAISTETEAKKKTDIGLMKISLVFPPPYKKEF